MAGSRSPGVPTKWQTSVRWCDQSGAPAAMHDSKTEWEWRKRSDKKGYTSTRGSNFTRSNTIMLLNLRTLGFV